MLRLSFIAIPGLLFTACISERNACPEKLYSAPAETESHMVWGGKGNKLSASIVRVSAECIRVIPPVVEYEGSIIEKRISYKIPVTARIAYKIIDEKWFSDATTYKDIDADMIFEAVSNSGVILGSSEGTTRIISGGDSSMASGVISGLSAEEIKRTASIRARWKYGR